MLSPCPAPYLQVDQLRRRHCLGGRTVGMHRARVPLTALPEVGRPALPRGLGLHCCGARAPRRCDPAAGEAGTVLCVLPLLPAYILSQLFVTAKGTDEDGYVPELFCFPQVVHHFSRFGDVCEAQLVCDVSGVLLACRR